MEKNHFAAECLKEARQELINDYEESGPCRMGGLCYYVGEHFFMRDIPEIFNIKNAAKHANAKLKGRPSPSFWWNYSEYDRTEYDLENRLLFMDWMINELEN